VLYFASTRFPVCLTASTEIASEMGGPVMATSAVGFSSTRSLAGKKYCPFQLGSTEYPKLMSAVAIGCLAIVQ